MMLLSLTTTYQPSTVFVASAFAIVRLSNSAVTVYELFPN